MALALDNDATQMAMEFPTRLVVRCSFKHLVRLLDTLSREGRFYAIRKLRVERMDTHGPRMLEAEIVAGAILFQVRNGTAVPVQGSDRPTPAARGPRSARGRRSRLAQQRTEVRYDG